MVRIPQSEAAVEANAVQNQIVITGIVCLGFLLPLGWWISHKGAAKVRKVQEAAENMTKGDYAARVEVLSEDEIGKLGTSFNAMAQEIETNIAQGREYQGKMEAINKAEAIIEFQMDGTILTANENFCQLMGYSVTEITGQHHRMFAVPEDANSPAYEAFWAKLNRGEFDGGVYKRLGKGGKEIWLQATYNPILDVNDKLCKVVKFATDITAQQNQAADFSGKIEAVNKAEGMIEFRLDGTILTANENFCQLMGYSVTEITGQHHRLFCDTAYTSSPEYQAFWAKLNRGEYDAGVYKRLSKGGKEIWIQATYNPVKDANGELCKVVKFATDITAQKKSQLELERVMKETRTVLGAMAEGDLSMMMVSE